MTSTAYFGRNTHITFEKLAGGSTSELHTQITNFKQTGGEAAVDSIPVFGGGNIADEKPRTSIEVSMDVILDGTTAIEFYSHFLGVSSTEGGVVTWKSSRSIDDYRVTIMFATGYNSASPAVPNTGVAKRYTYVHAKAVTFEPTDDADGYLKGTIKYTLTPTDSSSNPNYVVEDTQNAATTAFGSPYGNGGVRQAYGSYA